MAHPGQDLLNAFIAETKQRRRATFNLRLAAGSLILLAVLFAVVTVARGKQIDPFMLIPFFVLLTSGLSSGMAASHKRSALALSTVQDPAALGFLIECLDSGDGELTNNLEQGLTPLLRDASKLNTGRLEAGQEKALCTALQRTKSSSFFLAGLAFLKEKGTAYGLHTLDVWLEAPPTGLLNRSATDTAIRMAAADLRIRLAGETISAKAKVEEQVSAELQQRLRN